MRFLPLLGLLATLLALPSVSAVPASPTDPPSDETISVPSGEARAPSARDLAPHDLRGTSSEVWSYSFFFDSGAQAYLSFRRVNLGGVLGSAGGAELSLVGFNGETIRAAKQYDLDEFRYDASAHRLNVHPNIFFEGRPPEAHRVRFQAGKNGRSYAVDLSFASMARGVTWGDGEFRVGDERFGLFVHVPFARVSGAITVDGTTTSVSGVAYMDHTYQTGSPKTLASAIRYVSYDGDTIEAANLALPGDGFERQVLGYGLLREGGQTRLLKPTDLRVVSTRPALGADLPRQTLVTYQGGRETVLSRSQDRQQIATLEELGGIARTLARQFLGGEAIIARGVGTLGSGARAYYELVGVK
ncbi:MAG: hypothetical protein AAGG50_01850 [Bacteroidota bacterium]